MFGSRGSAGVHSARPQLARVERYEPWARVPAPRRSISANWYAARRIRSGHPGCPGQRPDAARGLRPLLELHEEEHVAGERDVGDQLQGDERKRALHHRGDEREGGSPPSTSSTSRRRPGLPSAPGAAPGRNGLGALGPWPCAASRWCGRARQTVVEVTDRVRPHLLLRARRSWGEGAIHATPTLRSERSSPHRPLASPTRRQRISRRAGARGCSVRFLSTRPTPGVRTRGTLAGPSRRSSGGLRARGRRGRRGRVRRYTPERPPVFSQRASSPDRTPQSTDLHMS